MLRAMGNLAQRYGDAARSGVYRVNDGSVPRIAAAEAGALLIEVAASRLGGEWDRIEQDLLSETARSCVLIVAEAGGLAFAGGNAFLQRLGSVATARRNAGVPLFVVVVDPDGQLALPPLYREKVTP